MSSLCCHPVLPVLRQLSVSVWIKQWKPNSLKDKDESSEKWESRPREDVSIDRDGIP